ncbi:MAG: hypothetical protein LBQ96_03950 [Fusobacteriaceae bacterium]|jgi:hypothetical protein|nr:hypothetical protein [Fusobacteriaceae bacterium]
MWKGRTKLDLSGKIDTVSGTVYYNKNNFLGYLRAKLIAARDTVFKASAFSLAGRDDFQEPVRKTQYDKSSIQTLVFPTEEEVNALFKKSAKSRSGKKMVLSYEMYDELTTDILPDFPEAPRLDVKRVKAADSGAPQDAAVSAETSEEFAPGGLRETRKKNEMKENEMKEKVETAAKAPVETKTETIVQEPVAREAEIESREAVETIIATKEETIPEAKKPKRTKKAASPVVQAEIPFPKEERETEKIREFKGQYSKILQLAVQQPYFTRKDVERKLKLKQSRVLSLLKDMTDRGMLSKEGVGKSTVYMKTV